MNTPRDFMPYHCRCPLWGFVFFLLYCCSAAAGGLPDTIEHIKPSIVGVGTYQKTRSPPAMLLGSGFAIGNGHYVLTNLHVVDQDLDKVKGEHLAVFVGRGSRSTVRKAGKIAVDRQHDLAILRIKGAPLPAMKLSDSSRVREGELYAFTGFPIGAVLGLFPVTHRGVISAITPIIAPFDNAVQLNPALIKQLRTPFDVFQLDATAYPGNSGSPLYDPESGVVIGVINMVLVKGKKESVLSEPSGITYAIPIEYAHVLISNSEVSLP